MIDLNSQSTFSKPEYDPAISGSQQAAQQNTFAMRKAMLGSIDTADPSGIEYAAYKLSQEAVGAKPVSRQNWKMMYRHDHLTDGGFGR